MEVYFKGKEYKGKAAYINGYNGHTESEDDGMLCALIIDGVGVLSCWDNDCKPNNLTDCNGNNIINKNLRGSIVTF